MEREGWWPLSACGSYCHGYADHLSYIFSYGYAQIQSNLKPRQKSFFAEQLSEINAYRPEKRFADAVKGLHLYGAKVVYPTEMVLLDLTVSA